MLRLDRTALVLVVALCGLLAMRQIGSPDAGYHLAAGHSMLAGDGWPRTDSFTHTVNDHAYIDTTWGYEVLLALSESAFGTTGMVLLHVGLVIAIFTLVALTARLAAGDRTLVVVLLLIGGLASESRFEVRPELLSYAFLALMVYLLHRRSEHGRAPLWLLALSLWLWSNSHSQFVLGYVVLAAFNLGEWLRHRRIERSLLAWSAIAAGLTLVNPYGWQGVARALSFGSWMQRGHLFGETIGEFESPFETLVSEQLGFYLLPMASLFLFIAAVLASIPFLWRQRRFTCMLLALVFVPLSLSMVRNAPLLVITCLPGTVWALQAGHWLRARGVGEGLRARAARGVLSVVALIVIVFGTRVFNDAYYTERRRLERFGFDWNALRLPVDAAAYLGRASLPGRMLNQMSLGGYLVWAVPDPVFIDGRLEVFGIEFFRDYLDALSSPAALERSAARYDIGWLIFPFDARPELLTALSKEPRWRLVYVDHQVVVFVRTDRAAEVSIDGSVRRVEAPVPALDLGSVPGLGASRPGRLRRWLEGLVHRQRYPVEQYRLGVFHYLRGDMTKLAWHSAQAIRECRGAYYELYSNLGSAVRALGHLDEARRCYAIALAEAPAYKGEQRRWLANAIAAIDRSLSEAGRWRRPFEGGVP